MAASTKITLISDEGERFEVEEAVALQSQIVKQMIEANYAEGGIPVPNVSGVILAKAIEYCKKHAEDEDLKAWDADFVRVDQSTLFDMIRAANYLNITNLHDLTCQTVAEMMKDKTAEELKLFFNIDNDLALEEEEGVRRENQWGFK